MIAAATRWVMGLDPWELIALPVGFVIGIAGSFAGWFA